VTNRLKIIFAGSGEFGLPTLRALLKAGHELVTVVSQPDRPAGRGRGVLATPVAAEAISLGLPLLRTADVNREPLSGPAGTSLPEADVMVVIAFGQKIADAVVCHPRLGSVNLHASRLPKYRGAAPINWAIINGDKTSGNSIIRLAQKMDAGAILAQSEVPIGELETAGELHDRLAVDGASLVLNVLEDLAAGRAVEREQDHAAATVAPKLTRESAKLDWTRPATELACRARGLFPWPGCRVKVCDAARTPLEELRLVRARAVVSDETERWGPGEVMSDGTVATGSGALQIVECQPDGGRPMPLADYRRGHRWHAGLQLVSGE
jgi:methionyl-tRNA formyltransferase